MCAPVANLGIHESGSTYDMVYVHTIERLLYICSWLYVQRGSLGYVCRGEVEELLVCLSREYA